MTYTSLSWVGWMLGTVIVFWATPARARMMILSGITMIFLAVTEPISLGVLALFTAVTYGLTRGTAPTGRRAALAVVPIAAILLGYKVLSATSGDDLVTDTIIPLGLSYYALRCIHYAVERYKGNIRDLGVAELIEYLFFVPTIFVGPIHRFPDWKRDVQRHRWDAGLFFEGLERILYGYVKIVALGNYLVTQAFGDWAASVTTPDTAQAVYLEMIRIGFNLYFQFSGFSDIAIGFARLLGFRVMENFNWPLLQRNISAFWANWHISLTSWSRDYVYTSAIAKTRSPAFGAIASLVAIALWHEVSPRYLLWGIYHGLGIIIWQQTQKWFKALPKVENRLMNGVTHAGSVVLTIHFVFVGFLLVRQPDLGSMISTMDTLVTEWG